MRIPVLLFFFLFLFQTAVFSEVPKFILSSPSFSDSQAIPEAHACTGKNISPALQWKNAPPATQSFVLIVEDPDAPIGSWTHWVVYNIPPMLSSLPAGLPKADQLVNGEIQGRNDFQSLGYGGPCPPSGTHRYYFRLYALDYAPALGKGLRKMEILRVIKGHVLGEAVLMGTYSAPKKES